MGRWEDFLDWIYSSREVEFDVETTPTDYWCTKVLRTVQFGRPGQQWVLQWSKLSDSQKTQIKCVLEDKWLLKVIHNAMFECVIMRFNNIRIQNVFDTQLSEQVLYGGEQDHRLGYGLDDVCWRRFGITLDKSYQLAFNEDILTPGHIVYAAQDVTYLTWIKKECWQQCQEFGLEWTVVLECEALPGFAEMVYHGMPMDTDYWLSLQAEAEPIIAASMEKLNEWLSHPPFRDTALRLGYISASDRLLINWDSSKQKAKVFAQSFKGLPGTTKAIVVKFFKDRTKAGLETPEMFTDYLTGDYQKIEDYILTTQREWLIQENLLIPANTSSINWGSPEQALNIIKVVEPHLHGLSEKDRGTCSHPIIVDYEKYKEKMKLLGTYGESFLKHLEPDGRVRTRFNLVLTTGRISSSEPPMQQIPADPDTVGNKYRNGFTAPSGWKFVSSDFVSQELVIVAYLTQDPVWMEVIRKNQDLHSVAAELVYKQKWKDAAEPNCAYYQLVVGEDGILEMAKKKCKCKKHAPLRYDIKAVNFGLIYGMSHFKLAATLKITVPQAKALIIEYFKAFPKVGATLEFLGSFGVRNGYIQTIWPFYRRRWFPMHALYTRFIDTHLSGAQYHPGLGEIERASKNMPKMYGHIKSGELREGYGSEAMLILSQATQDIGCVEGATTTKVSSNNNLSHERPSLVNFGKISYLDALKAQI